MGTRSAQSRGNLDRGRGLVVLKFGGTSVATAENWDTIKRVAQARLEDGLRPIIVCSALAGITNELEGMLAAVRNRGDVAGRLDGVRAVHHQLASQLELQEKTGLRRGLERLTKLVEALPLGSPISPSAYAEVMAQGELLSTRLGADWLSEQGLPTEWRDAREWLASDDPTGSPKSYLSATCPHAFDPEAAAELRSQPPRVVVTQGFIARNPAGHTVLLGRGGSDTSATYLAARLGAASVEIWTDVPGVFTANPRVIPGARLLGQLSYDEAEVFAGYGAKILHPRCVDPLRRDGIPLEIRWVANPDLAGTRVADRGSLSGVKGVSLRENLYLVKVEREHIWQPIGFMADFAACFKERELAIDLLASSSNRIQATIDPTANPETETRIIELVEQLSSSSKATFQKGVSSLSLVGHGMNRCLHKLAPIMHTLESRDLLLVAPAANDLSLSFVVPDAQGRELLQSLHEAALEVSTVTATLGPTWAELTERSFTDERHTGTELVGVQ